MKTPLTINPQANGLCAIPDACGVRLAHDLSKEDAAVIALCVNSHDGLVEALKDAHPYIDDDHVGMRIAIGAALAAAGAA